MLLPFLGEPYRPILWLVTLVKFSYAVSGLNMRVFAVFPHITQLNPHCLEAMSLITDERSPLSIIPLRPRFICLLL